MMDFMECPAGSVIYSKMDLHKRYHQIPINKATLQNCHNHTILPV
jgi:hypothetical protein